MRESQAELGEFGIRSEELGIMKASQMVECALTIFPLQGKRKLFSFVVYIYNTSLKEGV